MRTSYPSALPAYSHCHKNPCRSEPILAKMAGLPIIRLYDCRHTAATIMLSHGIPPIIVTGMLGHSISIRQTTYAYFIPTMQDLAAQVMDDIINPIPMEYIHIDRRTVKFTSQEKTKEVRLIGEWFDTDNRITDNLSVNRAINL